jgi:hypothetical protein
MIGDAPSLTSQNGTKVEQRVSVDGRDKPDPFGQILCNIPLLPM